MNALRTHFRFDDLHKIPRPLIANENLLPLDDYQSLRALEIPYQRLRMKDNPISVWREFHFTQPGSPQIVAQLELALCIYGAGDALEYLFRFIEGHQRPVPVENMTETNKEGLSDFGLAWKWADESVGDDVLGFVRNNVVALLRRFTGEVETKSIASELDNKLVKYDTCDAYVDGDSGVFQNLKGGQKSVVAAGEKIVLGLEPEHRTVFFSTSRGSVNRDPANRLIRYYRAPLDTGTQQITAYSIDTGMIPVREQLTINVIRG